MSIKPDDPRFDMAADAFRGAAASIRVGLQLLGELRAEAVKGEGPKQTDPDRPPMFGGGKKRDAEARPTPAVDGGSQQTEG